jgi:hypothetical protein
MAAANRLRSEGALVLQHRVLSTTLQLVEGECMSANHPWINASNKLAKKPAGNGLPN